MRQQLFFEDHLKDFANDKNEAGGSELPWTCYFVLGLRLLLRGANLQEPEQFENKDEISE